MKTKLLLSVLLSFSFYLLSSQVPQGFNYQAIARDELGDPIVNTALPVTITVQSLIDGGTVFWEEEHSTVSTNGYGLFKLVIGDGLRLSGEAAAFSDIDWSVLPKFIKTQIFYDTELKDMGTSELWSVPYSMIAGNINDTLNSLFVRGNTTDMEEALFQVKNKDGQIIFAVYNEGVRVYVADGDTKGKKGGFAIGGFGAGKADAPGQEYFVVSRDSIRAYIYDDPMVKSKKGGFAIGGFGAGKGFTNDYLLISPDSSRVYVNNNPSTKAKKGGFAIGGFNPGKAPDGQQFLTVSNDSIRMYIDDVSKAAKGGFAIGGFGAGKAGNSNRFFDVATDATGIINPSQNRILWYPLKNAFLAGRVRIGTPDSVGINSFSTGYESKARGMYSQAMGFKSKANGDYSTAIGKNSLASQDNSFAFGDGAKAVNQDSYAFGAFTEASGIGSFAFGYVGRDSIGPTGNITSAEGDYSFAFGLGAKALAEGAIAMGVEDTASGPFSLSMGYKTKASKYYSVAIGNKTKALEHYSTALGNSTVASGYYSFATGSNTIASGFSSTAIGYLTTASGSYSTAMGAGTTASGYYSTALGTYTFATNHNTTSMGYYTIASGYAATSLGYMTTATGDFSTSTGLYSDASGKYSTAMGSRTVAPSAFETAIGRYNTLYTPVDTLEWNTSDRLFVIGNGTGLETRSDAVTVLKNGNMGIGTSSPAAKLDVSGISRATAFNTNSGTFFVSDGGTASAVIDFGRRSVYIVKASWGGSYHEGTRAWYVLTQNDMNSSTGPPTILDLGQSTGAYHKNANLTLETISGDYNSLKVQGVNDGQGTGSNVYWSITRVAFN